MRPNTSARSSILTFVLLTPKHKAEAISADFDSSMLSTAPIQAVFRGRPEWWFSCWFSVKTTKAERTLKKDSPKRTNQFGEWHCGDWGLGLSAAPSNDFFAARTPRLSEKAVVWGWGGGGGGGGGSLDAECCPSACSSASGSNRKLAFASSFSEGQ